MQIGTRRPFYLLTVAFFIMQFSGLSAARPFFVQLFQAFNVPLNPNIATVCDYFYTQFSFLNFPTGSHRRSKYIIERCLHVLSKIFGQTKAVLVYVGWMHPKFIFDWYFFLNYFFPLVLTDDNIYRDVCILNFSARV